METLLPDFDYAPAPVDPAASMLRERYGFFAGGDWCEAAGGSFTTLDPATEKPLADVSRASAEDVDRAVRAARRAYDKYWRKLRPAERAKHLFRLNRAVGERARELSLVQTLDAGTPIRRSREDVTQSLATLFVYAGWADKLQWAVRAGERTRPLGVVASFGTGNAPALEAACALAPALAAGNAAIFVPGEAAPLAALVIAQASLDADLPPGVISIVTGDARTRAALADHADVDAVASRGPREQCVALARDLAGTRKRALLKPEASGALFVFDDAPLDQAVEGIVRSLWMERGPFAPATARLFVQESVLDDVVESLRERLATLRLGDPLDANSDVGPLPTRERRDAAEAYLRASLESGATAIPADRKTPERGYWCAPALVRGAAPSHASAVQPCTPVVPVSSFRTLDEALEIAGVKAGASAGVWTSSGQLAACLAERLRAGTVWCNAYERYDPSAHDGGASSLRDYLNT